jgi:hypothetical protein
MGAGAIIGLIVPAVFEARYILGRHLFGPEVFLLWPSSIILMATDGREHSVELTRFRPQYTVASATSGSPISIPALLAHIQPAGVRQPTARVGW